MQFYKSEPRIKILTIKKGAKNMNESTGQSRMVTGLFNDRDSAERAYQSLISRGYSHEEANVIMSDETRTRFYPEGSEHTSALAD
jgi:hypothetical protein